jgi:uncharacterized membrane protein YcaP (DUF421 family)
MQMSMWHNMFVLGVPIGEKILRTVAVYAFLIVGLRLAGKRELAQLNPFDLVVLLTLSNTVQNAIIGEDNTVTGGVIGASTLLLVNYGLIENGQITGNCLNKEAISILELEAAAHKQGFASLAEIDRAILDTNGTIAFFARKPEPELARHEELMRRLDQITTELVALKSRPGER